MKKLTRELCKAYLHKELFNSMDYVMVNFLFVIFPPSYFSQSGIKGKTNHANVHRLGRTPREALILSPMNEEVSQSLRGTLTLDAAVLW